MNCHFIDFIVENIFSDAPFIADTFFNKDSVLIREKYLKLSPAYITLSCPYALQLSWVFNMTLNMYHDEITEFNRAHLLHFMGKTAQHYIRQEFPRQAVMLSVMNAAESWFCAYFPDKARVLHNENGITEVYLE